MKLAIFGTANCGAPCSIAVAGSRLLAIPCGRQCEQSRSETSGNIRRVYPLHVTPPSTLSNCTSARQNCRTRATRDCDGGRRALLCDCRRPPDVSPHTAPANPAVGQRCVLPPLPLLPDPHPLPPPLATPRSLRSRRPLADASHRHLSVQAQPLCHRRRSHG